MSNLVKTLYEHREKVQKPVKDSNLKQKLDQIKQEMQQNYIDYRRFQMLMHGQEIEESRLEMLLVFLIRKGILQ